MKKLFFLSFLAVLFIIPFSSQAAIPGLKAELVGYNRERLSLPDDDSILFTVKVTNTGSVPISGAYLSTRVPNSTEYPTSQGVFAGRGLETLNPGQSRVYSNGASYMLSRSKRLSGVVEFAFSYDPRLSISNFSGGPNFSYPFTAEVLPSTVDASRARLDIKTVAKNVKKVYSRGTKGAKLAALSFKSGVDTTINNPGFHYLAEGGTFGGNEISELTLWSGKTKICGPIPFKSQTTFDNCHFDLIKNKKKIITLKGDISENASIGIPRRVTLSTYSHDYGLDVYKDGGNDFRVKKFKFK